jgi:hypothetical protein
MVPNGVSQTDAEIINLSKAYMACNEFRGLNNLQFQALMLKTASDLYEASLAEAGASFLIPSDLIGDINLGISQEDSQKTSTFCSPAHPSCTFWNIPEFTKLETPPGPMHVWNGRKYKFPRLYSHLWMTNHFSSRSLKRRDTPIPATFTCMIGI